MLLGTLAAALTAGPAHADGTVVPDNPTCSDLIPGSTELKVEPVADGTFTTDGFSVTLDVRMLTADDPQHAGDQTGSQVVDFTATGGTVIGVVVKGGPTANFYDYRPAGVTSGTGLHAPALDQQNNQKFAGLSHISFCFAPPTTTTTSAPPTTTSAPPTTTTPPAPTSPLPTTLPKTGTGFPVGSAALFAVFLLAVGGGALLLSRGGIQLPYRRKH